MDADLARDLYRQVLDLRELLEAVAREFERLATDEALPRAAGSPAAPMRRWWLRDNGHLEQREPDSQIEYEFEGNTYSRPAQTEGSSGELISLRVNPLDPSFSSLDLARPTAWYIVLSIALIGLGATLVHVLTAA